MAGVVDLSQDASTQEALDALLPRENADFIVAFMLAAFRKDTRHWLGKSRIAILNDRFGDDADATIATLDRAPRPPALLGDASQWLGCRVPILHQDRVIWTEIFWRPDRGMAHRGWGSFAFRMQLPYVGAVEIRGRFEEKRLDAVMHADRLPRALAYDLREIFGDMLKILSIQGALLINDQK